MTNNSKSRPKMKLPNGFGSIIDQGERRRKPFAAYKTIGYDHQKRKQLKKYVGSATTWWKAYDLLVEYNGLPYDLDYKSITVQQVYEKMIISEEQKVKDGKISKSTFASLKATWNRFLPVKDSKVIEIRNKDIQTLIDKSGLKYTGRNYIRILWNRIIDYANEEFNLRIDKSIFKLNLGEKEKSNIHKVMKDEHIKVIEALAETNDTAKMIMINLYTGYRPGELITRKIEDIHLDEDYIFGGIKTVASKNKIVPIHTKIKKYIEYFYNPSSEYLIINSTNGTKMSSDVYTSRFEDLMTILGYDYKTYDTRHTFATKCDQMGIPENIIKRLMGHSLSNDITNDVYIHKTVDELKKYIELLNY